MASTPFEPAVFNQMLPTCDLAIGVLPGSTSTKVIVSCGCIKQNGSNFKLLNAIARKLKAGVEALCATLDTGQMPNGNQADKTEEFVVPDIYVATNKNEEAPIFQGGLWVRGGIAPSFAGTRCWFLGHSKMRQSLSDHCYRLNLM